MKPPRLPFLFGIGLSQVLGATISLSCGCFYTGPSRAACWRQGLVHVGLGAFIFIAWAVLSRIQGRTATKETSDADP